MEHLEIGKLKIENENWERDSETEFRDRDQRSEKAVWECRAEACLRRQAQRYEHF